MEQLQALAFALWGLGGIMMAVREHGKWCDDHDVDDCGMSRIFVVALLWFLVAPWRLIKKGIGR